MTWTLRRTDKALNDLADIFDYIALDNPAAAERLVMELLEQFDRTGDFPNIGRRADEIATGHRVLVHGRYLLIYAIYDSEQIVELVRVVHGARDWPSLFDS